jgi:hypothetical protein
MARCKIQTLNNQKAINSELKKFQDVWKNKKYFGTQNKERYAVKIVQNHGTDVPDVRDLEE